MANEHSNIVPDMKPTAKVADFKFWCQNVLPLVYDDSLSYYETLNKLVVFLNQVIDNINADIDNVTELKDDFLLLQEYVNNFFDDIDQLVTYTDRAEAAQNAAAGAALSAAGSATNAASSASSAATSATNAASSSLNAMDARDAAIAAKTAAEIALSNAQTAANNAQASATAASNSALSASGSATNAAASASSAEQSFNLANAARLAAQTAETNAASSASDAASSAADAAASSADGTKAQAMIAVQESTTATGSHNIGDYFRINGILYQATADIQIGDTIAVGTNCRIAVLGDDVTAQSEEIVNIANDTFSNQLTGIEANVYYQIDPPIKEGEKFTVAVADGTTIGRFIDYEWYDNEKTLLGNKRLYATSTSQTTIVSGGDLCYFRWVQKPAKFISIVRGDTPKPLEKYFTPYAYIATDLLAVKNELKDLINYPDSFTSHYSINSAGLFGQEGTTHNTTPPIWLNKGDVLHYRLCGAVNDPIIATYSNTGAFIEALASGTGNTAMITGEITLEQDCYVVASHRFYNVPNESPYFYINNSISYKAQNSITNDEASENTFVSGYGTLSGWETHAESFSKLMADVQDSEGFMFITDSHFMSLLNGDWKPYAYKIFSYLEKLYYSSPCSFVLHGGDWLGTNEPREDYLYKLSAINGAFRRNFDKFALLVGNHETGNQSAEGTAFTHDTLATTLLANIGKTYYKFNANTFAMYCFDSWRSGAIDTFAIEQIEWFANSLAEETAKHIVLAIHILYDNNILSGLADEITKCANAYNNRSTYTYNEITYDFTTATSKIGFVIAGHEHTDKTGTVNNIPYILTTNLTGYGGEASFNALTLPTDLIKVDWSNSTLTAYRATREQTGTTRTLSIIT